jgi:phytoene/squalene synthetase
MTARGYTVEDLFARRFDPRFRAAMKDAVEVARELFLKGLPLAGMVDKRLSIDLELFSRGGLKVLEKIERQDYDVLRVRPAVTKMERVRLLLGALGRRAFARDAA